MAKERPKKAKLTRWKTKNGIWKLVLWIPFHGSWTLAQNARKGVFDRKANQIIAALPRMAVEDVADGSMEA